MSPYFGRCPLLIYRVSNNLPQKLLGMAPPPFPLPLSPYTRTLSPVEKIGGTLRFQMPLYTRSLFFHSKATILCILAQAIRFISYLRDPKVGLSDDRVFFRYSPTGNLTSLPAPRLFGLSTLFCAELLTLPPSLRSLPPSVSLSKQDLKFSCHSRDRSFRKLIGHALSMRVFACRPSSSLSRRRYGAWSPTP